MTSMFAGTIVLAGAASAQTSGDVLHRANAGGSFTADGNTWDALQTYQVAGQDETSDHGEPSSIDSSVPSGTPTEIWNDERWDPSESPEMQYEFSVPDGQQVKVQLFFYDGYSGTSSVGDRVFDVSIEGQTVLDDFDIIETYGDDTGAMEEFTVTSDGTIDVDFGHVTENPQINAIRIVSAEPQSDTLGGPGSVDFGSVLVDNSETETVTFTNLGESGDSDITVSDVSISGSDASEFSHDFSGSTTLAPGDSLDVQVTFDPSDAQAKGATLEVTHDAQNTNSPLTVDLTGEGASATDPDFGKSTLQGFSAGNPTALEWGPDDRLYVSTQGGTVYALAVERNGENDYQVTNEVQIDAIKDIPNHDDLGNIESGENNRQITGLTVGGTASQPVVYVGSSDPEIDVGQDDDDTDTNSGAISRLTINPGSDGVLQASEVSHDVMVLGLPRSEENHATNGLDLTPDGDTLYVAQGGHTNKGAPGDNFGHTPEYALSAAVLEIDLAQIENNHNAKSLQSENSNYPDLDYFYSIPTVQGGALPFGGNDGLNQAKIVPNGPVQVFSPGYRNPYDLVLAEDGQLYVSDHGPNGGWGGQPATSNGDTFDPATDSVCTNHPNEDGSFSTDDQLALVEEGDYGGHAAPIRANPDEAGLYDASGNQYHDFTSSDTPVPFSMANPIECDYQPPSEDSNTVIAPGGGPLTFSPTGGTEEYTASNFGGAMQGDILQVELGGDIERVELNAAGDEATNVETIFNTGGPLGIDAVGDEGPFPGTVWTANHGGNDITAFEPVDYDGNVQDDCTGADDASLDEDGDGYDNADEIDAGTDPCSAASTPADFDDDGTSNLNDNDDDNDGANDDVDPFAVDPDNGTTTSLPVQHDLSELSLLGEDGQGWTGLMTNGQDDYQSLYDPTKMTVGGAAEVLTVEEVPQGDAYQTPNTQQYAFQFGVNPPDEAFVVESTVASFPDNPEDFQSAGIYVGTGDQSNYAKLVVAADGGNGGIEFAQEEGDSFTHQTSPNVVSDSAVTGSDTTLRLIVDPTTDPMPNNGDDEVALTAEYEVGGTTNTVGTAAIPASWLDTSDGSGLAVGVISTSNGASSTFSATWTDISVQTTAAADNTPPTIDSISDQTVTEGDSATVSVSASDADSGDTPTLSLGSAPDFASITDDGDGTGTVTLAPTSGEAGTYTVEVVADDGVEQTTESFQVTVEEAPPASGEVLYRVNNGGPEIAATDGGPAWAADTGNQPSQYLVGGDTQTVDWTSSGSGDAALDGGVDASVPSSTPTEVFTYERYDPPTDGEMQWEFPVQSGQQVEVRLYFADQCSCTGPNSDPLRVFDVSSEGQVVLDDYHISEEFGDDTAGMASFTVTSDGTLDIDFAHVSENPMINAIEIVAVDDTGDMTVAEAVAANDDGDNTINLNEIQTAISWWSTGAEVPNTGGETISLQQMQQLINIWSTGATVGDGGGNQAPTIDAISDQTVTEDDPAQVPVSASDPDGDSVTLSKTSGPDFVTLTDNGDGTGTLDIAPQSGDAGSYTVTVEAADGNGGTATESFQLTVEAASSTASADIAITPDSGIGASTFGGGSFQVTNTGEQQISSVTFDLSTASMPDMVWDPQGTAGDQGAKGFQVDSGVGGDASAQFSQPQNGQNADDGYQEITVSFTDFEPGETFTFSSDNDPTSIKGASSAQSSEAGPVSGLELTGSTVEVEYADGTTQTTEAFTDGSDGGAQATADATIPPAPSIDVVGVSESSTTLGSDTTAATVGSQSQTVQVSGPAGETVTLLQIDAELNLVEVPDYDGTPGYNIEEYEANNAIAVETYTADLGSDGQATVDVSVAQDDFSYFVAAVGTPSTETGLTSNTIVLEYDPNAGNQAPSIDTISDQTVVTGETVTVPVSASDADGDSLTLSKASGPAFVTLTDNGDNTGSLEIAPESASAGTYTVEVTADDGTDQTTESFQLTVDTATSTTSGTVLHRVNAGESETLSATDGGPDWTGVADTSSQYLDSVGQSNAGNYCNGDPVTSGSSVPSSTPAGVYDCERYGLSTWTFDVTQGSEVEVRLYLSNQFSGADTDGDRQYNVDIEGDQVLTLYDPVQDVGDDTGTVKAFTVTENGDGTVTITFDPGPVENPQVNAIEIVETGGSS
jgi:hypothetical protein